MKITCCYITNRKEPLFEWFLNSLIRQYANKINDVKLELLVVSYWHKRVLIEDTELFKQGKNIKFIQPLPSFCQGEHRLTKENYFSATIARNTGFAYAAPDSDYIVFIDDLSILMPTWLDAVIQAANEGVVIQGSYRKDKQVVVEDGVLISSEQTPQGQDSRFNLIRGERGEGRPEWLFGCSFGLPLQLALKVNGFDEMASITGYEDSQYGIRLKAAGAKFVYDKRMLTIESEEHHFQEGNYFNRIDPEVTPERYEQVLKNFGLKGSIYGKNIRRDASHLINDITKQLCTNHGRYRSYWNNYDLTLLREKIHSCNEVDVEDMKFPERWWVDDKPLSEL